MTITARAKRVIDNYEKGMSGGDDEQFDALIELGNVAHDIVDLENERDKLRSILQSLSDESWLDESGTETPELAAAKEAARDALA